MSTTTPRRTRAEVLRIALADDIVSGRLVPGFRLDERQLAAAGLAETRPHKGVVVAPVTERGCTTCLMAELQGVCSRPSACHRASGASWRPCASRACWSRAAAPMAP